MHGIKDNLEVRYVGAAVAAGSSIDNNSSRIDMAGYESVMFVTTVTDSVATGVATLVIQSSDADSDAAMANVTGTDATLTSAANDDLNGKMLVTELRMPAKRYVQATRVSATANIAYGEVIAILKPYTKPVSQHSTVGDLNYVSN
jgi:hypothetical protein